MIKTSDKLPQHHSKTFRGLPIVIEWPKGSVRVGKNPDGSDFKTEMKADYGYIADTEGKDGETLDVYVGPNEKAKYVYAVEQLLDDGDTDEYKIMLGFDTLEDAEEMYALHAGEDRLGDISEIPFDYMFDMVEQNQEEDEPEAEKGAGEGHFLLESDMRAIGRGEKTVEEVMRGRTLGVTNPDGTRTELPDLIKEAGEHTVIDAFMKNYEHEVDFYQECAALAQDKLDQALQDAGIKAVVSSRAKRPARLQKKLVKRQAKKQYKTFRDIYDDIIDLAGVRVALYLPADREDVGAIIEKLFQPVREAKNFPEDRDPGDSLGYVATHYLVHLRPETLRRKELRYADTQIEVQVASVLMHAWAEVTHDLLYKPEKGQLAPAEMKILQDLNELVQAGEAQLEKLQGAIEGRNGEDLRFEIAASLSKVASMEDFEFALEKLANIPTEIDGVPVYAAGAAPAVGPVKLTWVWNEQYGTQTMKGNVGDHTKFFKYKDNPKGIIPPNLYDQSVRGYATVSPELKKVTLTLSGANHPNNRFIPSKAIQDFQKQYPGYEVTGNTSAWASFAKARLAFFKAQQSETVNTPEQSNRLLAQDLKTQAPKL